MTFVFLKSIALSLLVSSAIVAKFKALFIADHFL